MNEFCFSAQNSFYKWTSTFGCFIFEKITSLVEFVFNKFEILISISNDPAYRKFWSQVQTFLNFKFWPNLLSFNVVWRSPLSPFTSYELKTVATNQTSAKRGPALRFVVEAKLKPLQPRSNSRQSKKMMVRDRSIPPRSEYRIIFSQISNNIRPFSSY